MPARTLESARPAHHPSDFSLFVDLWLVDGSHRSGHSKYSHSKYSHGT